ncbi:MAG: alpha/beta hydrolase, partial [Proteobacteria bacterium]|nr:alpha/beta hydrolase [Pseudomonadota bacterium]
LFHAMITGFNLKRSHNMSTVVLILCALTLLAATAIVYITLTNRSPDMSRYDDPQPAMMVSRDKISEAHQTVIEKLADYHAGPVAKDISTGRRRFASLFENAFDPADDIRIKATDVDGIPGEWILATNANPSNRLLYLHGGAFMVGSPATHRFITCELARQTGAAVLAVDYRMMPEFTVLNSHEDAHSAYQWILTHGPDHETPCSNLFVAGDSAGGALTLATIAWTRDNGVQAADGAVAFAPSVDASLSGPTWKTNLTTDYFLGPGFGRVLKIPAPIRPAVPKTVR